MAIRLSKAFGGSAESWLIQQAQYDLWQAMQKVDKVRTNRQETLMWKIRPYTFSLFERANDETGALVRRLLKEIDAL